MIKLILFENQMKKTSEENKRRKQAKKTGEERQAHDGKICFSEKCVEDLPDG